MSIEVKAPYSTRWARGRLGRPLGGGAIWSVSWDEGAFTEQVIMTEWGMGEPFQDKNTDMCKHRQV